MPKVELKLTNKVLYPTETTIVSVGSAPSHNNNWDTFAKLFGTNISGNPINVTKIH